MYIRKLVVIVVLFQLNSISAQNENTSYKNSEQFKDFGKKSIQIAYEQITGLKNGALLVRLQTSERKISALKNMGKTPKEKEQALYEATQVELQQIKENKQIIRAFLQEFKFCPVYFFYAHSSDSIIKKKFKNIFLDTNLTVDPNIYLKETYFLFAEKDAVYNSSIGFPDDEQAAKITESGDIIKHVAIVVKDKFFHQLKDPFPFYVKGYDLTKYNLYIEKLNTKISSFYQEELIQNKIREALLRKKKEKAASRLLKKERKKKAKSSHNTNEN